MYSLTKNKQYVIMCSFYLISFIMILIIQYLLFTDHQYTTGLNKYMHQCVYSPDSKIAKKLTSMRGIKYNLSPEKYKINQYRYCLVSVWGIAHVFLYMMIGFYCPNLFFPSLIIGILFEFGESIFHCNDILDVVFNTIGFGIGYQINKLFLNKKSIRTSIFYFGITLFVMLILMINNVVDNQYNLDLIN